MVKNGQQPRLARQIIPEMSMPYSCAPQKSIKLMSRLQGCLDTMNFAPALEFCSDIPAGINKCILLSDNHTSFAVRPGRAFEQFNTVGP